jgi:hypothetical protein
MSGQQLDQNIKPAHNAEYVRGEPMVEGALKHYGQYERLAIRIWGCGAGLTKDQAMQVARFLTVEAAENENPDV